MIKYEIKTDDFEYDYSGILPSQTSSDVFDIYQTYCVDGSCPQTVGSFDTIEEAQAEFSKHYADYGMTRKYRMNVGHALVGRVAWIEENEYDEDGEFDQGGDVWTFSAEPYEVDE